MISACCIRISLSCYYLSDSVSHLDLRNLRNGFPGMLSSLGDTLAQAGGVCLESQGHIPGVQLQVMGYLYSVCQKTSQLSESVAKIHHLVELRHIDLKAHIGNSTRDHTHDRQTCLNIRKTRSARPQDRGWTPLRPLRLRQRNAALLRGMSCSCLVWHIFQGLPLGKSGWRKRILVLGASRGWVCDFEACSNFANHFLSASDSGPSDFALDALRASDNCGPRVVPEAGTAIWGDWWWRAAYADARKSLACGCTGCDRWWWKPTCTPIWVYCGMANALSDPG